MIEHDSEILYFEKDGLLGSFPGAELIYGKKSKRVRDPLGD
jgi:hypothetical protein